MPLGAVINTGWGIALAHQGVPDWTCDSGITGRTSPTPLTACQTRRIPTSGAGSFGVRTAAASTRGPRRTAEPSSRLRQVSPEPALGAGARSRRGLPLTRPSVRCSGRTPAYVDARGAENSVGQRVDPRGDRREQRVEVGPCATASRRVRARRRTRSDSRVGSGTPWSGVHDRVLRIVEHHVGGVEGGMWYCARLASRRKLPRRACSGVREPRVRGSSPRSLREALAGRTRCERGSFVRRLTSGFRRSL